MSTSRTFKLPMVGRLVIGIAASAFASLPIALPAAYAQNNPQAGLAPGAPAAPVIHQHHGEMLPPQSPRDPVVPATLERRDLFVPGVNEAALPALSNVELAAAEADFAARFGHVTPGPARIGVVRTPESLGERVTSGTLLGSQLDDGRTVWTMTLHTPGAYGQRIHFTGFDARGSRVVIYARENEKWVVFGPYRGTGPRGDGDFWTESFPGDTVHIEAVGERAPAFEIADVIHFDRILFVHCTGGVYDCHLDAMCESVNDLARRATARINWPAGASVPACTGTLLNDLDPDTSVPYFITAYHCLNTQAEIDTLEAIWFWQKDACDGTLPNFSTLPRSLGGRLLETNDTDDGNDMMFMRLGTDPPLPGGIAFAGWTTATSITGHGIHHPCGSWKRASFFTDVGSCPGCTFCGDPTDYDYYDILSGSIQQGSSGSGIFNSSGQLAGQLLGVCCPDADCLGEDFECGNMNEWVAQYGEFETTHPIIQYWLQLGGTIWVDRNSVLPPDGRASNPFQTVGLGYNRAWDDTRLAIRPGVYPETLTMSKRIRVLAVGGTVRIGG